MRTRPLRAAGSALAVAAAFFAGLSFDHLALADKKPERPRPVDGFLAVLSHVENGYVDDVDPRELLYAATDGLMSRLDPHSVFMRPELFKALRDEASGEFDGLGLELTIRGEVLTVVSPMAGSPGERAGILPGDQLLAIDGAPTRELTLAEAGRRLQGPPGTRVTLELMRAGFNAPQRLTLVRDRIRVQGVEWRVLDPGRRLAYVRIKTFQDRTERALRKALDEARTALRGELGGLVLDLRNDPGGLVSQAVAVADVFLASGVIVTTEGRGRRVVEVEKAHQKETEPGYPLVVLVNRGTASASEIVAGALQDHRRAVVMGTPTFGKGTVQAIIELPDGAGLKLTVARYYTPSHRSIQDQGITPDLLLANAPPGGEGSGEDYLVRSAVDWLKGAPRPGETPAIPGR